MKWFHVTRRRQETAEAAKRCNETPSARMRNRQWPHSNVCCSRPTRKALLHTSAAKWPNARASGYPSAGCKIQRQRISHLLFANCNSITYSTRSACCLQKRSKFCCAQSRPNGRITAPAGTPTRWPKLERQQFIAFRALANRNPKCAHGTETPSGQALIWQVVIRSLRSHQELQESPSARAKHRTLHANICWPQTRGSSAAFNRGQMAELPRQRLPHALAKTSHCMYIIATAETQQRSGGRKQKKKEP